MRYLDMEENMFFFVDNSNSETAFASTKEVNDKYVKLRMEHDHQIPNGNLIKVHPLKKYKVDEMRNEYYKIDYSQNLEIEANQLTYMFIGIN